MKLKKKLISTVIILMALLCITYFGIMIGNNKRYNSINWIKDNGGDYQEEPIKWVENNNCSTRKDLFCTSGRFKPRNSATACAAVGGARRRLTLLSVVPSIASKQRHKPPKPVS